jgi:2-keto-4-pentenoate hydratase
MMTGRREAELMEAANLLLEARRTLVGLADLPAELCPADETEIAFVQDTIAEAYGAVGGWKVGAESLEAVPNCAPMPRIWIGPSGSRLTRAGHRLHGLEAEIAFLLSGNLPVRATRYSDEEVYAAVASCHPAIEVIESGLIKPTDPAVRVAKDADLQMHGGFVYGAAYADWRSVAFENEPVSLAVDSVVRVEAVGYNKAGNLLRLLPWLANEGSARTGGLRAGQWITTGSWTGVTFGMAGSTADARFETMGSVALRFG